MGIIRQGTKREEEKNKAAGGEFENMEGEKKKGNEVEK
jgi:hypothetical protein